MMETFRLTDFPFRIDSEKLFKRLHVRAGTEDAADLSRLVEEALLIGRPRAIYGAIEIEVAGQDEVLLGGVAMESRVLKVNLENVNVAYPFICTCGQELQEWSDRITDVIWKYWADGIKEAALYEAMDALQNKLHDRYNPGHLSTMSPGSLESWPISQQQPLFRLLGNPQEVRLTDSFLMVPNKSVSGISFPTDALFESCQLCQRENCPGRRAPYDETLYAQKYCPATN